MTFDPEKFRIAISTQRCVHQPMSMRVAAAQIGISATTLSRLENKQQLPDVLTLGKICQWLSATPNDYYNQN